MNLSRALQNLETSFGETIEALVVGKHESSDEPAADENIVLTREAGLAKLDYEYDNGYGGADCNPFYAWTKSRVFFVHEYDGLTSIVWVPRAPAAQEPMFGGQS